MTTPPVYKPRGQANTLQRMMEGNVELFQSIGLSEAKAKDTVKNVAVSNALKSLILEVGSRF